MKNIIVITDSAKIADVEFKSLRQKLMDKELLVKSDAMHWMLYTQQLIILFGTLILERIRLSLCCTQSHIQIAE